MPDEMDDYKQFILTAQPRDLIKQLKRDVKTPLVSAQNLVNVLIMMQSPTPAIQAKIDSGELNVAETLDQLTALLGQALDVVDFYKDTLDQG
jgi:hypothetical protein